MLCGVFVSFFRRLVSPNWSGWGISDGKVKKSGTNYY